MTLGDIIAEYRKANGMSMERFAELSGMSKAYVSILERNKTPRGDEPSPSFEKYRDVAKAIGMDVDELIRRVDGKISLQTPSSPTPSNIMPPPHTVKVPRLGVIACGTPILAEENIETYDSVPEYVQCDYTLICKGDSMINARIYDGDIVCIRQQAQVEDGEIAAVLVGDDEATLKRVRYYPDHIILEPENPMYKPLVFWDEQMNDIRIIGKATHFISAVR